MPELRVVLDGAGMYAMGLTIAASRKPGFWRCIRRQSAATSTGQMQTARPAPLPPLVLGRGLAAQ